MDPDVLLARYDGRVPRYTSYPTAPHFGAGVDGATYGEWLAALPADKPLSLYVHVPFCDRLCRFCGCHTSVARQDAPLRRYAALLATEIDQVADRLGSGRRVAHLHWGGGTPTALPADALAAIGAQLRRRFTFDPDAEIAVEVDPRVLREDRLDALAGMGITRASLGVQDFAPAVQRAIGRIQSAALTRDCVARLRQAGARSINLDLVYGLPYQTVAGARATAEAVLDLAPDRVAVFGYAHVPWMAKRQQLIEEASLPGPRMRFDQRAAIDEVLVAAGYARVGLDHYAQPGDTLALAARNGALRRNFQGYTTDSAAALIGFGASAIGALPQGYVQNAPRVPEYAAAIEAGRLATCRGVALAPADRLRAEVIGRLMCDLAVDVAATARAHAADLPIPEAALAQMEADGLVARAGGRIAITDAGRPILRSVAALFAAYLRPDVVAHAQAE